MKNLVNGVCMYVLFFFMCWFVNWKVNIVFGIDIINEIVFFLVNENIFSVWIM